MSRVMAVIGSVAVLGVVACGPPEPELLPIATRSSECAVLDSFACTEDRAILLHCSESEVYDAGGRWSAARECPEGTMCGIANPDGGFGADCIPIDEASR